MSEVNRTTGGLAPVKSAAVKPAAPDRPGSAAGGTVLRPVRDTTSLQGAAATGGPAAGAPAPGLSDVVARARAAEDVVRDGKAQKTEEPSLAIPGVPVKQPLPVTVKAQITISGTAEVNRMTDDACEIRLKLKGSAFIFPVERDVTVSLERKPDGSYLYRYKDMKDGEVSEGVAKDIQVDGATKRLIALDKKTGESIPISITDTGGGGFRIKGDGFEADINRVGGKVNG